MPWMIRKLKICSLTFSCLILCIMLNKGIAWAHPHVWVTMKSDILYGPGETITGLKHSWTFDEFYTAFALQGLDKDGDGAYSETELAELLKVNIDSLKEFSFFTFSKSGEQDLGHLEPVNAKLTYKDKVLTLDFELPLSEPVRADASPFHFSVYDSTFYISFTFASGEAERIASLVPKGCQANVKNPSIDTTTQKRLSEIDMQSASDVQINYATQFSQDVTLRCALN